MFCNIECNAFVDCDRAVVIFVQLRAAIENGAIGTSRDESGALRFPLSLNKDNDQLTVSFFYWTSNRAENWVI